MRLAVERQPNENRGLSLRRFKNENWDEAYIEQKGNLDVLPTVDDAIVWVNELITKISFLRF